MSSLRVSSRLLLTFALLGGGIAAAGCGSDDADAYVTETERAIRDKVRAELEADRLRRHGARLAALNESLAKAPTAFKLAAATAEAADGTDADGGAGLVGIERGEAIYTQNCASCHGARGEGDGPVAASLVPTPAKHSDGGYMNALSDGHLFKVIKEGGTAVGKSSMMAPWGPSLSDEEIRDVIEFVRSLADPPYSGSAG